MSGTASAAEVGLEVSNGGRTVESVVVHPLVLLSVTDHYNRVARDARNQRVVGVLLGEHSKGRVDVTNSFALPFEEDAKEPEIFFLDHDYLEEMFNMHRKVAARERIVGFYSTGPKIRPADLAVDAIFRRYHPKPVLVIVDVRPDVEGIPTQAYQSIESVVEGRDNVRTFAHVPSEVGASESEEVGVEHLLREINDPTTSTLAGDLRAKLSGLVGLFDRLRDVSGYLDAVVSGTLPVNNEILYYIQALLNLLPNTNVDTLQRALFETTNDSHLVLYMASLVRSVLALHDLVNNKSHIKVEDSAKEKKNVSKDDATADAKPAKNEKKP